ncbi:uncharacterized protein LOC130677644 [Microplitis mediator]|uniref:uncharacterized protein LOC130677644 n=1 Tax=Microplitis mediator TaxID=375433 RepID=UPI00255672C2|nr:uncharacterized protein LOC130677644 [Microplitis mediator]
MRNLHSYSIFIFIIFIIINCDISCCQSITTNLPTISTSLSSISMSPSSILTSPSSISMSPSSISTSPSSILTSPPSISTNPSSISTSPSSISTSPSSISTSPSTTSTISSTTISPCQGQYGRTANTTDPTCQAYMICVPNGTSYTIYRMKCPNTLVFRPTTKTCVTTAMYTCIQIS